MQNKISGNPKIFFSMAMLIIKKKKKTHYLIWKQDQSMNCSLEMMNKFVTLK